VFNFIEKRRLYFLISAVVIGLGVAAILSSLVITGSPFRLGVDFRSGTRFELKFQGHVTEGELRRSFRDLGFSTADVTSLGGSEVLDTWQVRTEFVTAEEAQGVMSEVGNRLQPIDSGVSSFQTVSPAVGAEVTRAAFIAITVAAVIILAYIMFTFRQVPNSGRYGACAVVAMLHDLTVIFGFVAVMGLISGWEVDALFLTAALTVAGFSLQDTIVVFDRIRENRQRRPTDKFEVLVNRSVLETVHRSLTTQLSAMFVLVAILLFGGASIRPFIGVLFVGLLSGTYSSIFTAVPLLVAWEKGEIPFLRAT